MKLNAREDATLRLLTHECRQSINLSSSLYLLVAKCNTLINFLQDKNGFWTIGNDKITQVSKDGQCGCNKFIICGNCCKIYQQKSKSEPIFVIVQPLRNFLQFLLSNHPKNCNKKEDSTVDKEFYSIKNAHIRRA